MIFGERRERSAGDENETKMRLRRPNTSRGTETHKGGEVRQAEPNSSLETFEAPAISQEFVQSVLDSARNLGSAMDVLILVGDMQAVLDSVRANEQSIVPSSRQIEMQEDSAYSAILRILDAVNTGGS